MINRNLPPVELSPWLEAILQRAAVIENAGNGVPAMNSFERRVARRAISYILLDTFTREKRMTADLAEAKRLYAAYNAAHLPAPTTRDEVTASLLAELAGLL